MADRVVLDTSALLCLINGEPGYEVVDAVLDLATMSAVNLSEAIAKLREIGVPMATVSTILDPLHIAVFDFDTVQARIAGDLRPLTRPQGLSLGDRACLALAMARGWPVLTADKAWRALEIEAEIRLVR